MSRMRMAPCFSTLRRDFQSRNRKSNRSAKSISRCSNGLTCIRSINAAIPTSFLANPFRYAQRTASARFQFVFGAIGSKTRRSPFAPIVLLEQIERLSPINEDFSKDFSTTFVWQSRAMTKDVGTRMIVRLLVRRSPCFIHRFDRASSKEARRIVASFDVKRTHERCQGVFRTAQYYRRTVMLSRSRG